MFGQINVIHTGDLLYYQYDIWGSTVNLASRIESTGVEGCICICKKTYNILQEMNRASFSFECRKLIHMKGFEEKVQTYIIKME